MLLSSHVLAEVAQTVEEIIVIGDGRVLADGPVGDFTSKLAGGTSTRVRTPSVELLLAALAPGGHRYERVGRDVLRVEGIGPEELGRVAAAAGAVVYELTPEVVDLETAFFNLTDNGNSRELVR